jgi:hypothetical protein
LHDLIEDLMHDLLLRDSLQDRRLFFLALINSVEAPPGMVDCHVEVVAMHGLFRPVLVRSDVLIQFTAFPGPFSFIDNKPNT